MSPNLFSLVNALVALASISAAAPASGSTEVGPIYAFGMGINGYSVFYCDGKALISLEAPSSCNTAYNVTFALDSESRMVASPVNTTLSNGTTSYLYIDDSNSAWEPCGFVSTNGTIPSTETITGFLMFGPYISQKDSNGQLRSTWYAVGSPTDDDVYVLSWNQANASPNGTSYVIALKNSPPTKPAAANGSS